MNECSAYVGPDVHQDPIAVTGRFDDGRISTDGGVDRVTFVLSPPVEVPS